jgi:uncharacterized protein
MKTMRHGFALPLLMLAGAAFANDAPPSDASLQELASVSREQEAFNGLKPQLDAMITASVNQVSKGRSMTPERQAVVDRMREKIIGAFNESFNFESLQAITVRIYQATYTQDEVDGLIAFYKTPAGQALINKKPLMLQNMMDEMRVLMRPLVQRIEQIKGEADQEIKALPAHKQPEK